jgi:hypothetical protein
MARTLLVRLEAGTNALLVPNTEVDRDLLEDITWQLDDDSMVGMRFVPRAAFPLYWISNPKWYVFSKPEFSLDRRQMTIQDKHQGNGTIGDFIYQLRVEKVELNGTRQRFVTGFSSSNIRTSNDPVIINR